jgi:hypothetical protein
MQCVLTTVCFGLACFNRDTSFLTQCSAGESTLWHVTICLPPPSWHFFVILHGVRKLVAVWYSMMAVHARCWRSPCMQHASHERTRTGTQHHAKQELVAEQSILCLFGFRQSSERVMKCLWSSTPRIPLLCCRNNCLSCFPFSVGLFAVGLSALCPLCF